MSILKIAAISLLPGIGVIGGFFFWCLCRCNAQLGGLSPKPDLATKNTKSTKGDKA